MSQLQKDICLTLCLKVLLIYFLWTMCFSVNKTDKVDLAKTHTHLFGQDISSLKSIKKEATYDS